MQAEASPYGRRKSLWSPETRKLCSYFDIDPLRLISSGSMVIIVPSDRKTAMLSAMEAEGVPCSIIGRIEEAEAGIKLIRADGTSEDIAPPSSDEIYKVVGKLGVEENS